jgi:hypothetical protein
VTTAKVTKATMKTAKGKPLGQYALKRGKVLRKGGICYTGAVHRPWTMRFYSAAWRLWLLYDPNNDEWYFWHPRMLAYLPMSYLQTIPSLQPVNTTANAALTNTVPIDVNNVPVANNNAAPRNVPNVPDNLKANPME